MQYIINSTAKELIKIWIDKNIEPQQVYRAADKVKILFDAYYDMWKKRNNDGVRIQQKRNAFFEQIENTVFDISKTITIIHGAGDADNFMEDELVPRALSPIRAQQQIAGPSHIQIPVVHVEQHPNQNQIERNEIQPLNIEVVNANGNRNLRRRRNLIDEDTEIKPDRDVCLMFDHIGLSHRYASLAFITIAKSFGAGPADITSSMSTMFRSRQMYREMESANIRDNFDITKMVTIHWDGKTYTSRGQVKKKKLAVVVSNSNEAKPLDIQTVPNGTALAYTEAIMDVIEDWNVQGHIISMCFDTEAVNTGRISGVCVQLEDRLNRELLQFGCRHHVSEIYLSASFESTVEKAAEADGPKIPIFEEFAKQYYKPQFNKQNIRNCREDDFFNKLMNIEEFEQILKTNQR